MHIHMSHHILYILTWILAEIFKILVPYYQGPADERVSWQDIFKILSFLDFKIVLKVKQTLGVS